MTKIKILVANGVNLDLLGKRQPEIYGSKTLKDLESYLLSHLGDLSKMVGGQELVLEMVQSNCEGEFLNLISRPWDGAVINPGAWSHTSLALADRLEGLARPYIEVHLSNLYRREPFRQKSFSAAGALGTIQGLGFASYLAGLMAMAFKLTENH